MTDDVAVLRAEAAAGPDRRADAPSRKTSTWAPGFTGGKVRTADYYPHPTG